MTLDARERPPAQDPGLSSGPLMDSQDSFRARPQDLKRGIPAPSDAAKSPAAKPPAAPRGDFTDANVSTQGKSGSNMVGAVAVATAAGAVFNGILQHRAAAAARRQQKAQFQEEMAARARELQEKKDTRNQAALLGSIQNIGQTAFQGAGAQGNALSRLASLFGGA